MNWIENSKKKLKAALSKQGNRSGPYLQWLKERQDDSKLRICNWNLSNGIPTFSSAFHDLESGLVCFAGRPNSGKSTLLVNLMLGVCSLNDDTIVLDISLDDPYLKRYQQYIAALSGLTYQEITTSLNLSDTKKKLLEDSQKVIEKLYTEDKLRTIEAIETNEVAGEMVYYSFRQPETIFRLMRKTREEYPNKKIILMIDAWNNLDLSSAKGNSDLSQANYYLGKFQEEANKLEIIVILSAHLRKSEKKHQKSDLDDIKGTSDMAYNVVWAGIVRNELRENILKSPLVYEEGDKMYPVVAIDVVKTKVSTWDMPLLYVLMSGQCGIKPLEDYEYNQYLQEYLGVRK